jgi:hypothetical protein
MLTAKTGLKVLNVTTQNNEELKILVKKHKNRNEYIKVENYWIRNFNDPDVKPIDVNSFFSEDEHQKILKNEIQNAKLGFPLISKDITNFENLIVFSDGYKFSEHKIIKSLRPNVGILVLNHAMRFWESNVFPNFMLMNNTTNFSMSCMPMGNSPQLIASRRTWTPFLRSYQNNVYVYDPTPDDYFQSIASKDSLAFLDEYRNPICAAISFASYLNVKNLFLAFCGQAYSEARPGTIKIAENAYQYPQQRLADSIIDMNLFWYKFGNKNRQIFYTGLENSYKFARYLKEDDFLKAIQ